MSSTVALPLGHRLLTEGEDACAHCGQGTTEPERLAFRIVGKIIDGGRVVEADSTATLGVCASCRAVGDLATRLLDEHPGIVRAIGAPRVAQHRLHAALDALQAGGSSLPTTMDASALRDVLTLAPLGVGARWSAQFSPILQPTARLTHCAVEPWMDVPSDLGAIIRRDVAAYLARRLPPVSKRCPTGGCAICGVAAVLAPRPDTPWTPFSGSASALGGHGVARVTGHTCPTCTATVERVGTVGPALLQAAAITHLRPDLAHRTLAFTVGGLIAWATTGREPSPEPWAHVDLDALAAALPASRTDRPRPARRTIRIDPDALDAGVIVG